MQQRITTTNHHPTPFSTPAIDSRKNLIASSDGAEKATRQKIVAAALHVADAWQILVRAREPAMAKAVGTVAKALFLSCWTAIAAETFMLHRAPRAQARAREEGSRSPDGNEDMFDDVDDVESSEKQSTAIESARRRIAQAWDHLDGIPGACEAAVAEKMRCLGIAQFGEGAFRAAIVAVRMQKLSEADEMDWAGDAGSCHGGESGNGSSREE